jgi:hypothetical protein
MNTKERLYVLVDTVYDVGRIVDVVIRNVEVVDVASAKNEHQHGLCGTKSEEGDRRDQIDCVSRTWTVQEDVDADAEENQVYA